MLAVSALEASAQTDSLYIDATTLTARRKEAVAVTGTKGVTMDISSMKTLPSIVGSPDPIIFAQYLPSMSARTELEAGIHIQGNDHSHNMVSSGGVPIYGVSHLLGLFSVFNSSHFGTMRYRTDAPELNRLGGSLDMTLPESIKAGGDFQAGLIAAQGSLAVPVGDGGIRVSARRSYLNLLYGNFIKVDGNSIRYGFTDVNLTALLVPSQKDKVWLDAYWGGDNLNGAMGAYGADADTGWSNAMAALHWKHGKLHQTAYYTAWWLNLSAAWVAMTMSLNSRLGTAGYKAAYTAGDWTFRAETALHDAQPQNPVIIGSTNAADITQAPQSAWENILGGRYSRAWGPFSLETGLKGTAYLSPEKEWTGSVDPDLVLGWNLYRGGQFALRLGTRHQYLFQTGMTDLGMPSEFWFLAGKYSGPQWSRYASLSYMLDFHQGEYTFAAESYYKTLGNQVEYKGNVMDFLGSAYSLDKALLHGRGRAWGVNMSVSKVSGALTGWISYAWGRSLRSFDNPNYPSEYPSSHERIHELDAVASYRLGKWNLGANFVAASGTPYTAPEQLYLVSGHIVALFGEHNSSRLKPYMRADVSASYFFDRGPQENGITLSVYNVTGSENELFYNLVVDKEAGTFRYKGTALLIKFLPSVSYFHKF